VSVSVYTNRGKSTLHTEKKNYGKKAATARQLATHTKTCYIKNESCHTDVSHICMCMT